MNGWKNVVVAVDFSPGAQAALRSAESLVGPTGTIHVVHVVKTPFLVGPWIEGPVDLEARWTDTAREALEKIAAGIDSRRRVRTHLRAGDPWREILTVAREESAELLVVGSSGHSGIKRLLLGSTAENLVRHSGVPVWVARAAPLTAIRRVLLPIGFDEGSKLAVRFASRRWPEVMELEALHVIPPVPAILPVMEAGFEPDRRATEQELRELLDAAGGERARLEVVVVGDPAAEILKHAEASNPDLIVLATHGREGLDHALLGSVAEKVLRHAPGPVLVLPGPGRWAPWVDLGA